MKFSIFFAFLMLVGTVAKAQNFTGVATYQSSTKIELKLDSTKIPPERIKMIYDRMRQELFKEYELSFNKTASLFQVVEVLEQTEGGRGGGMMAMMAGGAGSTVYKNVKTKELLEQTEFFGKIFLIRDSLSRDDWKLGKETKQIGSYTCYKATTTREIITRTMSTDAESVEDTIQIEVTAWYTPQIPLSQGPDIYWGLPGLIMEVNTDKTTILCTKLVLSKEDVEIKAPKKGEQVTRAEYTKIIEEKMVEMEKMRGQRPGGGHGGGRGSMEIRISR
jgi:GLPGLI family protein